MCLHVLTCSEYIYLPALMLLCYPTIFHRFIYTVITLFPTESCPYNITYNGMRGLSFTPLEPSFKILLVSENGFVRSTDFNVS